MRKLKLFFTMLMLIAFCVGNVWGADVTGTINFGSASGSTAVNSTSVTGDDSQGNEWTITTVMSQTSFTQNASYSQIGASSKPATSITFTTTLPSAQTIKSFTAKFGGFSGTAGTVTLKVGETSVGTGSLNTTSDVTVNATNTTTSGTVLTVTVTGISKGVKAYYISYSYNEGSSLDPTVTADPEEVTDVVAAGVTNQTIDLTYENISDYETEVTVHPNADGTGTLSPAWLTASVTDADDYATVTYSVSANEGAARMAYIKVYTTDGDKEATTIIPVSQVKYVAPTGTFKLFSGDIEEGDYVIYYGGKAMNTTVSSNRLQYAEVTPSEDKIVNPDEAIIWHIAPISETTYWSLYNESAEKYAGGTNSKNQGAMLASITDLAKWSISGSSTYEFENYGRSQAASDSDKKYLRNNGTYGFACYASGTGGALTLYKKHVDVAVEKPAFSIAGGTYLGAQSVGITCETAGADIYYTLDGTDPSDSSTPYTGAISITETKTLKAIAIKGSDESAITSATYTIVTTEHAGTELDPYSVADAKIVIDGIGTKEDAYVSGIISQVDSYNSTYKSITYWISADGTTSGQQLQVYSGKGIDGADFSSVDDVVAKATVVVKGTLKKHNDTYEFDYNNELVSYAAPVEPVVTLKQSGSTVTVLNLEATGVANQAIDVECTNFADAISSVSAVLYEESTCETEITSGAWVTDITVNGASQVTFNVADNAGEARQVWLKVTASDGSNDAFAVLAISQAKYTVDYAELPFEFDGGKNDVANTNGMTHSGLGSDYSASPKLKFDGTGDWLIIKINEAPGKLTYDIKNNSFTDGTFTVQESADGETYTEVVSHTEIVGTQNEEVDLKQATRYVKFIYTEKVTGNVGLGNITISKYEAPDYGSYQRTVTNGNFGTICLPQAGTIEGATLYEIGSFENEMIYVDELNSNEMVAGKPYIFKANAAQLSVTYTSDEQVPASSANGLHGFYNLANMATDAADKLDLEEDQGNYILYQNQYWLVSGRAAYINNFRAYIKIGEINSQAPAPGRRRVAMAVNGGQVATGIDQVPSDQVPSTKVLIDGQLFILRGEKMYDTTGRLVK